FGLAPFASMPSTAARSPRSAASTIVSVAADATTETEKMMTAAAHVRLKADATKVATNVISDLRENPTAVTQFFDRDVVAVEERDEQVREPRVLRILQVLAAFDLAVRVAEDRRRQRIVVVLVAVGHVAAEQDRRVIEHRAVRLRRLCEPLDELREHQRVVRLDLHQLVHLRRVVAVMRQRMEALGDAEVRVRP